MRRRLAGLPPAKFSGAHRVNGKEAAQANDANPDAAKTAVTSACDKENIAASSTPRRKRTSAAQNAHRHPIIDHFRDAMETIHIPKKQSQSKSFKEGIVLHRYQAIYFQIPKVACSSIKHAFAKLLQFSDNEIEFIHLVDFPSVDKEHCNSAEYQRYLRFAFVRNPWDRLWSCYCSKIATRKRNTGYRFKNGIHRSFSKYKSIRAGMPFAEFVHAVRDIPDEQSDLHFRSQHSFVTDHKGELLVDFIGHFEQLQNDFNRLCGKAGMPKQSLAHKNRRYPKHCGDSFNRHYSHYYDDETVTIVADRFKTDIELFGYRFERQ